MPVEPNDVLRITAHQSYGDGGDALNVYHVRNDGVGDISDSVAISGIAQWIDDAHEELQLVTTDRLNYDFIDIYNVTQAFSLGDTPWPTLVTGGDAGATEAYARQVAALVKFLTNTARSQGRKYIAGLNEAEVTNGGGLLANLQTKLLNYVNELLLPPLLEGQQLIVGNWNPDLLRFVEWTAGIVSDIAATQRRRRTGVGS